jgi:hypothetical protein
MRAKIIGYLLTSLLILLSFSCQEKKKPIQFNVAPAEKPFTGIPSVCLFENTAVISEPFQIGMKISTLAMGEKVLYMKDEKLNPSDRNIKYLKIKLSDGKDGWVPENSLALDAKPAVAICKTVIYLRPDLVTITNKQFEAMDFVAVSASQNEWCEAKGGENKKFGWIKSIYTSQKDEDITVALLAKKALAQTKRDAKKNQLAAIINNPSFTGSIFIDTLKTCLSNIPPWDDDEDEPVLDEPDDSEEFDNSEEIE